MGHRSVLHLASGLISNSTKIVNWLSLSTILFLSYKKNPIVITLLTRKCPVFSFGRLIFGTFFTFRTNSYKNMGHFVEIPVTEVHLCIQMTWIRLKQNLGKWHFYYILKAFQIQWQENNTGLQCSHYKTGLGSKHNYLQNVIIYTFLYLDFMKETKNFPFQW